MTRPVLLLLFLINALVFPGIAVSAGRPQVIAYGDDPAQRIDFYAPPAGSGPAPLVVFIHGGAWRMGDKAMATGEKAAFFHHEGYAFAAINYRLVPEASVEDEADDVAAAVASIRGRAPELGVDPRRIALIGHSAGAHLAALVASDPQYLMARGMSLKAIRAVVLLDGAAYDVPRQIAAAGPLMRRLYRAAFGDDPERQVSLSPIAHAGGPNARAFQMVCATQRADSCPQATDLADALEVAGTPATLLPVDGASHRDLNRNIGMAGDPTSAAIAAFLRGQF